MAAFDSAFEKTVLDNEGGHLVTLGWNDRRADRGGETILGISRLWNPGWPGWPLVDRAKGLPDFPENLAGLRDALTPLARDLYRREYWDRVRGDDVPEQGIAQELFDTAVLKGATDAGAYLQRFLNVTNRGGRDWPDLRRDGWIGDKTLAALGKYLRLRRAGVLVGTLVGFFVVDAVEYAERWPDQEANVNGWLARKLTIMLRRAA